MAGMLFVYLSIKYLCLCGIVYLRWMYEKPVGMRALWNGASQTFRLDSFNQLVEAPGKFTDILPKTTELDGVLWY